MALPQDICAAIDAAVDADAPDLIALSASLHANPELRFKEVKAAGWISELVASRDITVEDGLGDMPTALRACAGTPGGPRVAILAEYDALPEIGHACGHNLIAAGAVLFVEEVVVPHGLMGVLAVCQRSHPRHTRVWIPSDLLAPDGRFEREG